jgi:hypothetical protein
LLKRLPIDYGIESASEKLAQIRTRHPLRDGDGLSIDDEVEEGCPAILRLPADGPLPSEKRVKSVFDLDSALVAGIINNALASVATREAISCELPNWEACQNGTSNFVEYSALLRLLDRFHGGGPNG